MRTKDSNGLLRVTAWGLGVILGFTLGLPCGYALCQIILGH